MAGHAWVLRWVVELMCGNERLVVVVRKTWWYNSGGRRLRITYK